MEHTVEGDVVPRDSRSPMAPGDGGTVRKTGATRRGREKSIVTHHKPTFSIAYDEEKRPSVGETKLR